MDHHYLVAEDDEDTQVLIARAFRQLDLAAPLHFVSDGEEAIAYLDGKERYCDRHAHPLPALLLLDFKMPRQDGLEVLRWVRASYLREMVVVMFSASDIEKDVLEAYRCGVN